VGEGPAKAEAEAEAAEKGGIRRDAARAEAAGKSVHLGGLLWQAVLLRLAVPGRRPVQEVRGVVLVQEASLGTPSKVALMRIRRMGSPSSGELTSFPVHCLAQGLKPIAIAGFGFESLSP
jgi:hypothetical protein